MLDAALPDALSSIGVKACPTCSTTYANDVGFCPRDGAALRSTAGLQPGSVIRKKYEILSEIGRGGMGVVYRARHLIWNEEKALKVLTDEGAGAHQGLKGLLAEALVMRQLQHPHIVRVEDADYTEDQQLFVVMEYVAGQSVRERLQNSGPLAPEVALRIAADICSALSAAHQKGIVHRDIKPQNLLLARGADGGESVKVIDFGIAKVREDAGLGFTGPMPGTTGLFVCTPGYASPEQAQGMRGNELDGRSDLYSLGLVLYEMLSGRLPFAAPSPEALLWQRLQVPPLPLDQARPGLTFPPGVAGVVMKALERERENRYRSAGEMQGAILTVLEARGAEQPQRDRATAVLAGPAQPERVGPLVPELKKSAATVPGRQQPTNAHWIKRIGAGVTLLVVLGIGLATWRSRHSAHNPAAATPAALTQAAPPPVEKPPNGEVRLARARELLRNGHYARAITEFKAVLEIDPGNAAAQAALRNAQSAWEAEQSLAGGAFDAAGTLQQASAKRVAGMYEDAIKLYQSVLAHDASNREARRGLDDARSALDAERKVFGKR